MKWSLMSYGFRYRLSDKIIFLIILFYHFQSIAQYSEELPLVALNELPFSFCKTFTA